MLTVACVLRSGGIYTPEWVGKLQRAVARHMTVAHRFVALSDVPVPCERIPLEHGWPGWWSKIELFRPELFDGAVLYFDLDTLIVENIDALTDLPHRFAMLRGFGRPHYIGSGVMWMRRPMPEVYWKFCEAPEAFMAEYAANPKNRHNAFNAARGDQAFIYDAVGNANIARLTDDVPGLIKLYPRHLTDTVPAGCSVVCFKGKNKPPAAMGHAWAREAWR